MWLALTNHSAFSAFGNYAIMKFVFDIGSATDEQCLKSLATLIVHMTTVYNVKQQL